MSGGNALGGALPAPYLAPIQDPNQILANQYNQQNALLGLQSNQMQLNARKALGQAYQQATDPNTGQIDQNKLMGAVSQGPASYMMGDIQQRNLANTKAQLDNSNTSIDIQRKRVNDGYNMMAGLATNPNSTPSDLVAGLAEHVNEGLIDSKTAGNILGGVDISSQQSFRQSLANRAAMLLDHKQQYDAMYGTVGQTNTGGGIQTQLIPSPSGAAQGQQTQNVGNPTPMTMTPGEATAPTQIGTTPAGASVMGTRQQFISQAQGAQPGAMPGPANGASPAAVPPGLLNPANQRAASMGGSMPGPANAQSGQGVVTGLGPGQQSALTASGTASGEQLSQDQRTAGGTAGRVYQLQQALTGLQNAPTGIGSEARSNIRGAAVALGLAPQSAVNTQASYDEANKYLTQYAVSQASTFGGHTDSQLATVLTGNASTHISNLAAQDVVKANIGLEHMQAASVQGFQQTGLTPDKYGQWKSQWAQQVDPRAFMAPTLSQQQFKQAAQAGGQKFRDTYNAAITNGWIQPPSWLGGGNVGK